MTSTNTNEGLADRLTNYSRLVSNKLELNSRRAGTVAALSAAAVGTGLSVHHAAEAAVRYSGPININFTAASGYYGTFMPREFIPIDNTAGTTLANFAIGGWNWFGYLGGLKVIGFGTTGNSSDNTARPGPQGEELVFDPGGFGPDGMGGFERKDQPSRLGTGESVDSNSPFFAPWLGAQQNHILVGGNNSDAEFSPNYANWTMPGDGVPNATATGHVGVRFNTAGNTNTTGAGPRHYGWVKLQLTNAGVALPIGDFNDDLFVAGADFLEWQRDPEGFADPESGLPGASETALSDWEGKYGQSRGRTTSVTAVDWAYETTPDTAISVGDTGALSASTSVPEPGTATLVSLGMLATGAAGLRRHRRTKSKP